MVVCYRGWWEAHLVTSSVPQTGEQRKGLLTKRSVGLLLEDDVVDLYDECERREVSRRLLIPP